MCQMPIGRFLGDLGFRYVSKLFSGAFESFHSGEIGIYLMD